MRTVKEILKDKELKVFWQNLVNDERFKDILTACTARMGKYSPIHPESTEAHIQTERNGGYKGWLALKTALLNVPDNDKEVEQDGDAFGDRLQGEL